MNYYSHSTTRRSQVDNRIWAWLAGIGLSLIAFGLIFNAFDAADLRDITAKIAGLEERTTSLYLRLPDAEKEFSTQTPQFAAHWSEGLKPQLITARGDLSPGGPIHLLNVSAQQALDVGNRTLARSTWAEADSKLIAAENIIRTILGPPAFFKVLQDKAAAVQSGYLNEAQTRIDAQRRYVDNMPRKSLCGSDNSLSYASAYSILDQAQNSLNMAVNTAKVVLPEDIIDLPLAYDQAKAATDQTGSASSTADNLSAQADNAANEIASCSSGIGQAFVELSGAYDYDSALSYYNQAVVARNAAISSCSSQDFNSVTISANNCKSYSSLSYDASQPPTPTPVPPPTSEPSSSSNSPSYDFGGGSNDNSGGGSSSGWDSSDDGYNGGGDSYSPDDGYGGGDSYSPDDGY